MGEKYEVYLDEDPKVYCLRMARPGEWADHVAICETANLLQRPLIIVNSMENNSRIEIFPEVMNHQLDTLFLGHVNQEHYVALKRAS